MNSTRLVWVPALAAALWVTSLLFAAVPSPAKSTVPTWDGQAWTLPGMGVPTFTNGAWVMPPRPIRAAPVMQYSGYSGGGWEQHAIEACAVHGCDPNYLLSIIYCESNGDPTAAAYNPVSGNMTLGLLQIDEQWGSIAYAGGVEQIWWAAAHLGDVWWACG